MGLKSVAQSMINAVWVVRKGQPVQARNAYIKPRVLAKQRTFAAGQVDRLSASFTGSHLSINEELRRSLQRMQQRSRDLCENNDYARRFLKMLESNVVGPNGITLQCQYQKPDGSPDLADREFVEGHWRQWAKKRNCTVDGKLSWVGVQNLVIKTVARDGEVLVEKIRSRRGEYILKLRVLECDHLDVTHNETLANGHRIVMGIEIDRHDAPVAYWLTERHPGDTGAHSYLKRRRVLAANMLHIFVTERPGQLRGYPWMHSAIRRLNMLGNYEQAELVGATIGASKMGFYTSPDGEYPGPDEMAEDGQEDDNSELIQQAEPGMFETLPEGYDFKAFDPQHPTSAFPDFNKSMLRGVGAGFNVSYENLANDRESVNFSSIRQGTLDERDGYRLIQGFIVEQLNDEIHGDWLREEIEIGVLSSLPNEKITTKFSNITWQARGWDWVDPLKDIKAAIAEFSLGATSISEIVARKGRALEDVLKQRQADDKLAEKYGQTIGQVVQQLTNSTQETGGTNDAEN